MVVGRIEFTPTEGKAKCFASLPIMMSALNIVFQVLFIFEILWLEFDLALVFVGALIGFIDLIEYGFQDF